MNILPLKSDRNPKTPKHDAPRTEVGEIDTRAPFKSVKAAVSLFGEVALSNAQRSPEIKPKHSSENMVNREAELLWLQKEFKNIKQKLEGAENTKNKAGNDLKIAKVTLEDLTKRLETASKSKQSAVEVAEELKEQAWKLQLQKSNNSGKKNEHKMELDTAKEKYTALTNELVAAKQQINEMRLNLDATLETKLAALQQAADAQSSTKALSEKAKELQKEVSDMKQAVQHVTIATKEVNMQDQVNIPQEKDFSQNNFKRLKEGVEKKLISVKKAYDPEQAERLLEKLNKTNAKIEAIQEEMKKAHALEMDSARAVTEELSEASITMQKTVEEETSLRKSVIRLRQELEEVKRKQFAVKGKESERERVVAEQELNASNIFEQSVRVQELSIDIQNSIKEAEEMKKNAQLLKREAEAAQNAEEEAKQNLERALKQAEEAKEAEKKVLEEMQVLSDKRGIANNEASRTIKISTEEFHSLNMKIVESRNMAEVKVTAANSGLQEINARRAETDKKLDEMSVELQGIEIAKELAENSATVAEAAQKVLEDELKSLH